MASSKIGKSDENPKETLYGFVVKKETRDTIALYFLEYEKACDCVIHEEMMMTLKK